MEDLLMEIDYKNVGTVDTAMSSKGDNYIRIDMTLLNGQKMSLVAEFDQYCKWLKKNMGSYENVLGDFVKDFIASSSETEDVNEIVDKDGNIYPDKDMPNNATNSRIGSSKFDLNKVYRQTVPMGARYYSGDLGVGIITW